MTEEEFSQLYHNAKPLLLKVARRFLLHYQDCEEVQQDVMLYAWSHQEKLQGDPLPWLKTLTQFKALNLRTEQFRRKKRTPFLSPINQAIAETVSHQEETYEDFPISLSNAFLSVAQELLRRESKPKQFLLDEDLALIDWTQSSAKIAADYGLERSTITKYRIKLYGVRPPRYSAESFQNLDWSLTDAELSRRTNIHRAALARYRKKHKL